MLLFVFVSSCNQRDFNKNYLSLGDFRAYLEKGMPCDSVITQFGKPKRIEGSGIHIFYYSIEENTEMMIGCGGTVYYARQIDSVGKTVRELF